MPQNLSDEQLVAQIVQGQADVEETFTELYRRHSTYVKNIVRSMVRNSSLAAEDEEITQELFRKLFQTGLRQYEGRQGASFRAFLTTVTKNAVRDTFRARSRQDHIEQEMADETRAAEKLHAGRQDTPRGVLEDQERFRLLMEALAGLAHTDFLDVVIIVLSTWGGLTDRAISGLFDMTADSVRKRRGRAYVKLRQVFKEWNLRPEDVL